MAQVTTESTKSVGLCEGVFDDSYLTKHLRLGAVHFHVAEVEGIFETGKSSLLVYTGSSFSFIEPVEKNKVLEQVMYLYLCNDKYEELCKITAFNDLINFLVKSLKRTDNDTEAISPVIPGMKDAWLCSVLSEIAESLDGDYGFVSAAVLAAKVGVTPKQAREYLRQSNFNEIRISKRNVVFSRNEPLHYIAKGCF